MKETVIEEQCIENVLRDYLERFTFLKDKVELQEAGATAALEAAIDDYSIFVLDNAWQQQFEFWKNTHYLTSSFLIEQLQNLTAECVKLIENARAKALIEGGNSSSIYFDNIEHCIDEEFGQFSIYSDDTVLLIGSGAYPMTLVQITKETNAKAIGLDVDQNALIYGKQVVERLAPDAPIKISGQTVAELPNISEVTHIIFSSTVPIKYSILDELYALTNNEVIISMRFGNKLKSLFNYPKENVDSNKWQCIETINQPDQIFDIALYRKQGKERDIND